MPTYICNSSEEFFKYYLSQIIELSDREGFYLNSQLGFDKKIVSNSRKATSIKDLVKDLPLLRIFFKAQGDVFVFLSVHPLNFLQILILRIRRKKIIQIVHDPVAHPDNKSIIVEVVTYLLCKVVNRVVLHSEFYLENYRKKFGDVEVLPLLGYKPDFEKKDFNKTLLVFGRMEPYKGLDNISYYIDKGVLEGWKVIVAGKGTIPERLFNEPNVEVLNRFIADKELSNLINKASYVFMPYDSATQSAVVLHSYSKSTPVICHDVGALREYVENSRGFLFPRNDFRALGDFLAAQDNDTYSNIVKNVEDYFERVFAKDTLKEKLEKTLTL